MRIVILLLTANLGLLFGQDFAGTMKEVFKGDQFKHYTWFNYPLDDFGVGTSYRSSGGTLDDKGFLCATFTCLSISPVPSGIGWLKIIPKGSTIGFADAPCGGPEEVSLKRESKKAVSAFLPALLSVVGLTADLNSDNTLDVQISFTSACERMLLSGKFETYLRGITEDTYGMKDAFQQGRLVVVVGDVVVNGLALQVKPTSQLKAELDATLEGKASKTFGAGAKGSVEVSKSSNGTYKLSSKSPLIVGRLGVKQKTALISSKVGWDGWQPVVLPDPPISK